MVKMETCLGDIHIRENTNLPHSGSRVWSSSHVLTKYLEKHRRKLKIKGKVLELGAGCGMNGIMMSLIGCDTVVFTDIVSVLDHLQQNVELNLLNPYSRSSSSQSMVDANGGGDEKKKYAVRALDWESEEDMNNIKQEFGSFQFIIGSDVVYQEQYIEPLLKTLRFFTEDHTSAQIMIAYEIRNESAHEMFLEKCPEFGFEVKEIPTKLQHEDCRDELVLIYHLRRL